MKLVLRVLNECSSGLGATRCPPLERGDGCEGGLLDAEDELECVSRSGDLLRKSLLDDDRRLCLVDVIDGGISADELELLDRYPLFAMGTFELGTGTGIGMANPMWMSAPSRGPADVCGRRDFFFEGIALLKDANAVLPDELEPDCTELDVVSGGVAGSGCFFDEIGSRADDETSADLGGA